MYSITVLVFAIITSSYAEIQCPTTVMTSEVREAILNAHNDYRRMVAKGQAKDGLGGYAPKAAAMPMLTYSCEVEKIAAVHASRCQFKHSDKNSRSGLGENIFMSWPPSNDKVQMAKAASKSWFGELAENGVGQKNVLDEDTWNRDVGHYTQMVWQGTTSIGCSVTNCPKMTFVVCNYKRAGNMLGQHIYEKGETCSKCSRCKDGLCVPH